MALTSDTPELISFIASCLMKEPDEKVIENLKTFRKNYFVETGDIHTGEALCTLIKCGIVYKVEHMHDYNTPDFGITQRGLLVFEELKFKGLI